MNADIMERLVEASKYQKKAIMALFPDNMAGHLKVIEKEISAMFMEYAMEVAEQCMQKKDTFRREETSKQADDIYHDSADKTVGLNRRVRKISIDS